MRSRFGILAAAVCSLLLAMPMAAASASSANKGNKIAMRSAWPAETLSGTITMVDPGLQTVVVQTSGGVPFDMVVTKNTRIESGSRTVSLQDLEQDTNQKVSVRFVPERRGDVARTIQLNG